MSASSILFIHTCFHTATVLSEHVYEIETRFSLHEVFVHQLAFSTDKLTCANQCVVCLL